MSGGSFGYLCWRNASDLLSDERLEEMADELEGLGHLAKEPAERTRALCELRNHIDAEIAALHSVWHAVEWWRSCDYSRDQAIAALGAYRERQSVASENKAPRE